MWRWADVKMRRCEDEQMWRSEDVKMRRCEDEQMWRWADVKMRRCEDEQMWRWEDVKMRRCEDEKMWRWADVKMRRCEDEQMWRWEDVKMSRCEDEKMWRWADVKMRRCQDEQMWRWEDVKMRRCEDEKMRYRPPLLEEPCAQTPSGKIFKKKTHTDWMGMLFGDTQIEWFKHIPSNNPQDPIVVKGWFNGHPPASKFLVTPTQCRWWPFTILPAYIISHNYPIIIPWCPMNISSYPWIHKPFIYPKNPRVRHGSEGHLRPRGQWGDEL